MVTMCLSLVPKEGNLSAQTSLPFLSHHPCSVAKRKPLYVMNNYSKSPQVSGLLLGTLSVISILITPCDFDVKNVLLSYMKAHK